jgi:hypothetical protein
MPLYKKRRPNLKIYTYPNSKCDLLRRDDMNAKLRLKLREELTKASHS